MGSYSENYKNRNDERYLRSQKNGKKEDKRKEIKTEIKIDKTQTNKRDILKNPIKHIKKRKYIGIFNFVIAAIILLGIYFIYKNIDNFYIVIIGVIVISAFLLYFVYRKYEKAIYHVNPRMILIIIYILLIVNMILGTFLYSIEWAFLGFFIATVIFYDSKIDSRYLIIPALLLLGYIPFLLIAKQNAIAENIAVYVYYFLVVGVILQFIEYKINREIILKFEDFISDVIYDSNFIIPIILFGIITIGVIIFNRFYYLEVWKWTCVYLFVLSFIGYLIKGYFRKGKIE
ncbi:hypothetical protein GOV12_03775 [Candidatus Pacearchaeota archaeon]|nr:hypothetical protein [Candidatus Pacearchaeota archaeon]